MKFTQTRRFHKDLISVFFAWFTSRIVVVATMWITNLFASSEAREFSSQGFRLWDAGWYQQLISGTYAELGEEAFRFFPGFVLLGRLVKPLLGGDEVLASVLIANLFSLCMFAVLYRLVIVETGNVARAKITVWMLALFPTAFVLVWGYAESLFITLTLVVFLALKKQNWKIAALVAFLAGLTRPTGALIAVAVVTAPGFWNMTSGFKARVERLVAFTGGPLGVMVFLLWSNSQNEKKWVPFTVQEEFRGGFVDPVRRLISGAKEIFALDPDGLHVLFAFSFFLLLVVVWKNFPRHYFFYAFVSLLVAVSAENLNSLERYVMAAFPFVMALAVFIDKKKFQKVVYPLSAVCLVACTVASVTGRYVP